MGDKATIKFRKYLNVSQTFLSLISAFIRCLSVFYTLWQTLTQRSTRRGKDVDFFRASQWNLMTKLFIGEWKKVSFVEEQKAAKVPERRKSSENIPNFPSISSNIKKAFVSQNHNKLLRHPVENIIKSQSCSLLPHCASSFLVSSP